MSATQDRIEENIGAALEKAKRWTVGQRLPAERPDFDRAQTWALIACAEALDGIRQALVRGEAGATVTSYIVTP